MDYIEVAPPLELTLADAPTLGYEILAAPRQGLMPVLGVVHHFGELPSVVGLTALPALDEVNGLLGSFLEAALVVSTHVQSSMSACLVMDNHLEIAQVHHRSALIAYTFHVLISWTE